MGWSGDRQNSALRNLTNKRIKRQRKVKENEDKEKTITFKTEEDSGELSEHIQSEEAETMLQGLGKTLEDEVMSQITGI